jgi:hypothetical protein
MSHTRNRRRRAIEEELEDASRSSRQASKPAPDQMLALQRQAGNHAVTRMLDEALLGPSPSEPARQELARRAADDGELLDAIRGAAGLRAAAVGPGGSVVDPSQSSHMGPPPAGPGILLGEGDDEIAGPGVIAPVADAEIEAVEGPEGAPTGEQAPAVDPADTTGGTAPAPAPAAPTLTINSRTDMKAPDGTPDTRKKVGMGEVVYFDVGGAAVDWTASAGWPPRRKGRSTFAWELPTPGTATITATDPVSGASASVEMEVVAPDELKMKKESEDPEAAGVAGAGMWLIPRFGPRSVSFGNVEWLEEPRPASSVSGYWLDLQAAGTDLDHHPNPDFLRITPTLRDHAFALGLPSPYKAGHFHWVVPNSFRRAATSGTGITTVTGQQNFDIDATGTVTIEKQGASVTRSP